MSNVYERLISQKIITVLQEREKGRKRNKPLERNEAAASSLRIGY